jgi:hypothetical protein
MRLLSEEIRLLRTRTAGVIAKSPGGRSAISCANRLKMALVFSAPSLGTQW